MADIFALVEHRQGAIRDITYELMACGRSLAEKTDGKLTALVLGADTKEFIEPLKSQAHRLLMVDAPVFKDFNSASYQAALSEIIRKEKPFITLMGHTAFGMDLCPSLATELKSPFTTDCLEIDLADGEVRVVRQMFDGKLDAWVRLRKDESYFLTVRLGSYPAEEAGLTAEVAEVASTVMAEPAYRRFIDYIEPEVGEVDITKSDIVVGVGRGVKKQENMAMLQEFADAIGGVLGCTRPVVDAEWLPNARQVGSSGKTIKPKLYIALGISGAFQHMAGLKGADTIIVVNKDPNAPIFNAADYGIVEDMFKVLPALKEKILEIKG